VADDAAGAVYADARGRTECWRVRGDFSMTIISGFVGGEVC
jgi:hypothetical protein